MNNNFKAASKEIEQEVKAAAKEEKAGLDAMKAQVRSEARGVKHAAGEKLIDAKQVHAVGKEIKQEKKAAVKAHDDAVKELKYTVAAEAEQHKAMCSGKAE